MASTVFSFKGWLACGLVAVSALADEAPPFLSPMFGDNMVLQRGVTNTVWGWTKPGEKVRVRIQGSEAVGVAGSDGRWEVKILPPSVSGAVSVWVVGNQTVELHNVLVGDVWLCGGQSNMEFPVGRSRGGQQVVAAANQPEIRLFTVKSHPAYAPAATVEGKWKICTPSTITEDGGFSAVGYYFALKVRSETNVPIGLIKDCIGGTPAESWTSARTLRSMKDFDAALDEVERLRARGGPQHGNFVTHWYDEFDIGQKGESWASPGLDDSGWQQVTIPGGFRELGVAETPGVCYFRRQVVLPDPLPAGKASLRLGVVERMDTAYINGRWVGASAWVENPRNYSIGDGILKPGTNLVTVRVLKTRPDGGFRSRAEQLELVLGDKSSVALAGEWKGKVSVDARPPHPLPMGYENWPTMPAVLYNGMIAPVAPLALAGALWYQGEANAGRAAQYRQLLPAMIGDWRKSFGREELPFYVVSLASFMQHRDKPGDDSWAELREAQAYTAATVPHAGLALAIDLGDANDIHPLDKKEVGERLALWALKDIYGRTVVASGPVFAGVQAVAGGLKVTFTHADGGLVAKGGKLEEFSVAGADGKWHWAEARIEGDAVVVSSAEVAEPKHVRYAWQSNPKATLYNGAGLPAVPFRTGR
jgi:sialate O-acetylesterase